MAKKRTAVARGQRGPAGPTGPRGSRGRQGERGLKGLRGIAGVVLGADADPRHLIKVLDIQVDGIYRELTAQMNRMARVQAQLDEVRTAIKQLTAHHRAPG